MTQTAAAILAISDERRPGAEHVERLGVALYGRFLDDGPYAQVRVLSGAEHSNEALGAAIVELAEDHGAIDVFLSVHTTERPVEVLTALVPPAARKLRLVYSTACHGDSKEREAWEALGPRAVVTHVGINNPLVAFPYVLAHWIAGEPIGAAVSEGYAKTRLVCRHAQALPNVPQDDVVGGSRPVISGDRHLRVTQGVGVEAPRPSPDLRYAPERGGPLGLILRALAGRIELTGAELVALLGRLDVRGKDADPILRELAAIERVFVERGADGEPCVVVHKERETVYDLGLPGIRLHAEPAVRLHANDDMTQGRVLIEGTGLWFGKGLLKVVARHVQLEPDPDQAGYRIVAAFGLWGLIPVTRTFFIGGTAFAPDEPVEPIYRELQGVSGPPPQWRASGP